MARITLTEYECEHDLLPAVCVKCGQPAQDRLVRTFRIGDGRGPWGFWRSLATLYGILMFPPLLLWALRRARSMRARVPYCRADRANTVRQERFAYCIIIPCWIIGVVMLDSFVMEDIFTGRPGLLGLAIVPIPLLFTSLEALTRKLFTQGGPATTTGFPLTGVHPAFVSALVEDRARDCVANPDRRALRGDIRDDFDDER
ncbi:MAG: hypothetical protein J2P46_02760 [Zavarzinella sp.]|nr:hypothetical protein [Zavarzinella sp.]